MATKSAGNRERSNAERLKELRETLGLSLREMAHELGVTHAAVAQWESCARPVPGPVLKLMGLYETELGLAPAEAPEGPELSWKIGSRAVALSKVSVAVGVELVGSFLEKALSDPSLSGAIRKRARMAIARNLIATLGRMKGFPMKVGQLVSYVKPVNNPRHLHPETRQWASARMSPGQVAKLLQEEFGKGQSFPFADWSEKPVAAASIGQVHRARLKETGQAVAVKLQYPRIVEAIEADMRAVAKADALFSLLFAGQKRGAIAAEMRERFLEECDYDQEARFHQEFRDRFAGTPGMLIPRVFQEHTRRRVLVTEFVDGQSFEDFARTASKKERDRAGEIIWQFSYESIFRHGIFNCDPNPGNYLFKDGKVVFLDFGCTKRFSPELLVQLRGVIRAVLEGDLAALRELTIATGWAPDARAFDFESHARALEEVFDPWLRDEVMSFSPRYVAETWEAMTIRNPNKFRICFPKDWIFLNRLQWGVGAVLAQLGSEANWRRKILPLVYASGEALPKPRRGGAET